jgi:membrane protein
MPPQTRSLSPHPLGASGTRFPALWRWWEVFKDAAGNWSSDQAMTLGASLAYYTLFSLAPLVLISVVLIGVVLGNSERARAGVLAELHDTLGADVADAIETLLNNANTSGSVSFTAFGVLMLLFGASGAFVQLQDALNRIWKAEGRQSSGVWEWVRARLLSLSAVLGTGFLLLVSLVVSSTLAIAGRFFSGTIPFGAAFWWVVNFGVSLALITCLFALVFRLLPDAEVAWSDVWVGAFVSAALFTLGKYLFSVYLARSGVTSMYGSAASVVVVLLWVYYSSLILLFGAEVAHSQAALRPAHGEERPGPAESR